MCCIQSFKLRNTFSFKRSQPFLKKTAVCAWWVLCWFHCQSLTAIFHRPQQQQRGCSKLHHPHCEQPPLGPIGAPEGPGSLGVNPNLYTHVQMWNHWHPCIFHNSNLKHLYHMHNTLKLHPKCPHSRISQTVMQVCRGLYCTVPHKPNT